MREQLKLLWAKTRRRCASLEVTTSILLVIAVSVAAFSFLYHAHKIVLFPYELTNAEELFLRDAIQIRRGQQVYTEVNDFPLIRSGKPPLFSVLAASLIPLVGRSLATTRLVAALSTLLTPLLIGSITYQAGRRVMPSVACGCAYLGSIFVYQWGAWGRVDPTAILFSLLAILVVLHWPDKRGICLAAFCCLLSLYTKQTLWAAPAAIILWLLWRRQVRHALGFALLLGAVGGALFLLFTVLTRGQFFLHLVVYNVREYSYRAFFSYWRAYLLTHGGIAAIALLGGAIYLRDKKPSLPLLYLGASALMTVTVGRAGASSNYFLELVAATLILCGLCWGELANRRDNGSLVMSAVLLLQLVWFRAFPFSPLAIYYATSPSFGYTPQASDVHACEEVDRYVRSVEGEILTEAGGFALRNGKELYTNPSALQALDRRGLVDEGLARLEEALTTGRFSLVILTGQYYPPRVLEAVRANYRPVDTVDCVFRYEIFVPIK